MTTRRGLAAVVVVTAAFSVSGPAQALSEKKAMFMLDMAERNCLSGEESTYSASLKAKISSLKANLKKGLDGELAGEAKKTEIRGAVGFTRDEIKKDENDAVRDCLNRRMDPIFERLLEDEQSMLDLRLGLEFQDPASPLFEDQQISVGTLFPKYPEERRWPRQPPHEMFSDVVPMLEAGGPPFRAWLTRTQRTGTNRLSGLPET